MRVMKKSMIALIILFATSVITSCNKKEQNEVDFSSWDDEKVLAFLQEVEQRVWKIPAEVKTKEEAIKQYEVYFTTELSKKIVDANYDQTDDGWRIPDGDAGYIFFVPGREPSEGNKLTIEYNDDVIKIRETYEDGMYKAVEYTIQAKGGPIISDWIIE